MSDSHRIRSTKNASLASKELTQSLNEVGSQDLKHLRARLLRHAKLKFSSRHDAEDVVQATLVAALEGRASYSGEAVLVGWLMGILKHKIVDETRRLIRDRSTHFDAQGGGRFRFEEFAETAVTAAPAFRLPCAELELRRFLDVLAEAIAELPPTAAQIFVLRDVAGASVTHICDSLGVTKTNCGVILYRARRKLRATLSVRGFGLEF